MRSASVELTTEELLEERFPRVSKKVKYVNLIERVRRDPRIADAVEQFPLVRKSVGSIKIAELRSSTSHHDKFTGVSDEISTKEEIPWHLLEATPTQIEDIVDNWLLERIAEDNGGCALAQERPKNIILKFVEKRFRRKVIKKRIGEVGAPEIYPVREFEELRGKVKRGRSKEFVHWRAEPCDESVIHSHDLLAQPSMGDNQSVARSSKSASIESSDLSTQCEELAAHRNLLLDSTISDVVPKELEERFKISHVLSDFSLQKCKLVLDM